MQSNYVGTCVQLDAKRSSAKGIGIRRDVSDVAKFCECLDSIRTPREANLYKLSRSMCSFSQKR